MIDYNKPILFLDLDGVIVLDDLPFKKKIHSEYIANNFDKKCVNVLNEIIKNVNPIIILSSDWRYNYSFDILNKIFHDNGVISEISGITDNLWGIEFKSLSQLEVCRATEILKYVNEHDINNYVAVDDLNLFPWIPKNFVYCTRFNEGIKQTGIKEKIIDILT